MQPCESVCEVQDGWHGCATPGTLVATYGNLLRYGRHLNAAANLVGPEAGVYNAAVAHNVWINLQRLEVYMLAVAFFELLVMDSCLGFREREVPVEQGGPDPPTFVVQGQGGGMGPVVRLPGVRIPV